MSEHINSKEALIGALLGALVGCAAVKLMTTSNGKDLKQGVKDKYKEIRGNIDEFIGSLEKNLTENVNEHTEEWTDKAKEALEYIKEKIAAADLSEHKELFVGLLGGVLFGTLLGAGGTLMLQNKSAHKEENIFQNIACRIHTWKPLIAEIQKLLEEQSRPERQSKRTGKVDDVLEFATAALKLWKHIKRKE